jgi:hypothetical protein
MVADDITFHISVDTEILQKQLSNLERLVRATSGGAERSEFHRGWCACLEAVMACFTAPLPVKTTGPVQSKEL